MKKFALALMVMLLAVTAVFAQGAKESADSKTIDNINVYYVPSREPAEIVTQTEPLKELLKSELAKEGYTVKNVTITVGTTYEAVGAALIAGTADVGLIPADTYITYDDGAEVILTATRAGLSVDDDNAAVWNANEPITGVDSNQVVGYRGIFVAGPSAKGKELAAKVNAGEKLTWDDLNSANWSVMSSTSSAGYVYPTIYLSQNYDGKTLADLDHTVIASDYGSSFARLAAGQVDILLCYADARRDQEKKWNEVYGMKNTIWEDTDLIAVTPMIYNDTVSVSKNSPIMTEELKAALQKAFMNLNTTPEGQQVIAVYSHSGYLPAVSSDYDNARLAKEFVQSLSN